MTRCVAVSENVLALRHPKKETVAKFMERAEKLHDQLNDYPRDELSRSEPAVIEDPKVPA